MIVDEARITVKAGSGGDGAVSFRREKFAPKGGPDGGNGGNGGDVWVRGVSDLSVLSRFRYQKKFAAENGQPGRPRKKHGARGRDLELIVPVGTVIRDKRANETFEILEPNQRAKLAQGGKGGRGNWEFRTSTHRRPTEFEPGVKGQERELDIELQFIADVGLVGLPNSGKSSLLNALTRAKAQVANYPFTTLEPNLGTLDGFILADIPGLIEGAAEGKGLGHKFLRHVRRTKILAHLISVESQHPVADYDTVRSELEAFDKELLKKKEMIILTKVDLIGEEEMEAKLKQLKNLKLEVIPCSVMEPKTLSRVKWRLIALIHSLSTQINRDWKLAA